MNIENSKLLSEDLDKTKINENRAIVDWFNNRCYILKLDSNEIIVEMKLIWKK